MHRGFNGPQPRTGDGRKGLALATALVPDIGYDQAAEISHEAFPTGESIQTVALRRTDLGAKALARILDPRKMTKPTAVKKRRRRRS